MTSSAPPPDLSWLDLGPNDSVSVMGVVSAPVRAVGLGLAAATIPAIDDVAAWKANLAASPHLDPEERIGPGLSLGFSAGWWTDARPPVLVVQSTSAALFPLEGALDLGDGRLLLGVGGRPGHCRLVSNEAEVALQLQGSTLRWLEVHRAAPPWADAEAEPGEPPHHPVAIGALLAGWSHEPWLGALAAELAALDGSLGHAAAAGAILRLWQSPQADLRGAAARLAKGEDSPPDRVRSWVRAAPPGWTMDLLAAALLDADRLHDDVDRAEGGADSAPLLRSIVHRRDDLESVLAVLEVTGSAGGLRAALEALDARATARLDLAIDDELTDDPRLAAVSWMDPAAWWGTLAGR